MMGALRRPQGVCPTWNSFHNEALCRRAAPRECFVLSRAHMPAYGRSLRPRLAPRGAPRQRSVIVKRVLRLRLAETRIPAASSANP
jgi:hypothetical protein